MKESKFNTKNNPFKVLYSWESPERHWTPKDRAWYVYYSFLFVLIVAVAALLGEYFLIMAIIAFVFLWFTQASIPPENVEHSITTLGIKTYGKVFKWDEINHFWFTRKGDIKLLNLDIETPDSSDGEKNSFRMSLLIENDEEEIFSHLVRYIDYGDKKEIDFNFFNKLTIGDHIDITTFLKNEAETQEEYIENTKS